MTNLIFIGITLGFWVIMSIYWFVKACSDSQTKLSFEISSILKLVFSALIMYLPLLYDGWFSKQLFSANNISNITGVVVCGAGIIFAISGRASLGKNWSGKVIIQENHSLIQTGPYKITRNPQYTGAIAAYFGTAIVIGQVFGFVWSLILAFGLILKAKLEEKILSHRFPDEFPAYRKRVKLIIPFLY